MVGAGYSFSLSRCEWSSFVTLTFRGEVTMKRARFHLDRWLKWAAHANRQSVDRLIYMARFEHGEKFGRLHIHVLLSVSKENVGNFVVQSPRLSMSHKVWGLGMTSARAVLAVDDSAVVYMLKGISGADAYERDKFNSADDVVVSQAAVRYVTALHKRDGKLLRATPCVDTGLIPV